MTKGKTAFLLSTQILGKQWLYMWTFTFAEVLDVKDTRKRWSHLLALMREHWPQMCGMHIFEMHEFHDLHVNLLTNRFLDVNEARRFAQQAGWG